MSFTAFPSPRRRAALAMGTLLCAPPFVRRALAQIAYPSKPIVLLVPYGAGGSADYVARHFADKLQGALGQPLIVENLPGAAGSVAAAALLRAPADGHTLLIAPMAMIAISPLARATHYAPLNDFTPVAKLANALGMVVLSNAQPARNLLDFVQLAKRSPGEYSFGSSGVATLTHLSGEVLQSAAGIRLLHVPYKSIADATGDLITGRISMVFEPATLSLVHAGKATAVAALGRHRHSDFPAVPTIDEIGIDMKGFWARAWFGLFGPRNLPAHVVMRINIEAEPIARSPELGRALTKLGLEPDFSPAPFFAKQLRDDTAYFEGLLKQLKMTLKE